MSNKGNQSSNVSFINNNGAHPCACKQYNKKQENNKANSNWNASPNYILSPILFSNDCIPYISLSSPEWLLKSYKNKPEILLAPTLLAFEDLINP